MFFPLMRERRFSIWTSPPDTWRLLSFFLFFFFGEVIKRDRWKGAEWIQMKSFALLLSAAIRLLQIWLWGFFFLFLFRYVCVEIVWDQRRCLMWLYKKIFESSVCVRCQQIAIEQKLERSSERNVFEVHAGRYKAADGPLTSAEISSWIDDTLHRDVHYVLQISAAQLCFFFCFF